MDKKERFFDVLKTEMTMLLATALGGSVTMRAVSPVPHGDAVLIFTDPDSEKYRQLRANPNCCIAAGGFFAQCRAEFCGAAMLPENEALRRVYSAKFPGAFDEGVAFGGRGADFLLLRPTRLTGWAFENDMPTPDGVPTLPFDIALDAGRPSQEDIT